uniref:Uncharacterized protein n=1 Tax=Arundo donax TaxID=35708 RepID=A0A0A9EP15_ARUDO
MFASCISLFMAFGKPLVLGITSFVPDTLPWLDL